MGNTSRKSAFSMNGFFPSESTASFFIAHNLQKASFAIFSCQILLVQLYTTKQSRNPHQEHQLTCVLVRNPLLMSDAEVCVK